jgi:hypothetical protein
LFNSAHLTATQQDTLVTDVQKILADGGASLDDAVNVATSRLSCPRPNSHAAGQVSHLQKNR